MLQMNCSKATPPPPPGRDAAAEIVLHDVKSCFLFFFRIEIDAVTLTVLMGMMAPRPRRLLIRLQNFLAPPVAVFSPRPTALMLREAARPQHARALVERFDIEPYSEFSAK